MAGVWKYCLGFCLTIDSDDNSAHYTPGVYPSSEELDTDESEVSYDSSDDNLKSSGDEHEDDDDEVDLCMWGTWGLGFPWSIVWLAFTFVAERIRTAKPNIRTEQCHIGLLSSQMSLSQKEHKRVIGFYVVSTPDSNSAIHARLKK